jgi:5'-nucleotidase
MRILVSNDDSVYSAGINTLYNHLKEVADVQVIAPDRDSSAASNSLTISHPIRTKKLSNGFISVEGTPTDSVYIANRGLLDWKPDYVVSGINHGANLGEDVMYSGTVAAAMEGMMLGIPSIAISLASTELEFLETAGTIAKRLIMHIEANNDKFKSLLNVNVPPVTYDKLKGIETTRLGRRGISKDCIRSTDPRNEPILWIGPPGPELDASAGSDFHAIANDKVSITPIRINMTDYHNFKYAQELLGNMSMIN